MPIKHFAIALAIITICFPLFSNAQIHSLEKLWETDSIIAIPESVLPDANKQFLYVSLIDGAPWEADGKGGIGKLSIDGKQYDSTWIKGLNAPKGLGKFGNRLYVADISAVVVIDIRKGIVEKKIPIEGANGLNDISVDADGVVYVSDSRSGKVYRIEKDLPLLYIDKMSGANGLKAHGKELFVLANKAVLNLDAGRQVKTITSLPNGGDGVEEVGNGDLIVSEWIGYIYYVYADGRKELLLDTHLLKKNTADIYYDTTTQILYVPGFGAKTVTAYRLNGPVGKVSGTADWSPPRVVLMDGRRLADLKKN